MKSQSKIILVCIGLLLLSGCAVQKSAPTKSSASAAESQAKLYQQRAEQARLYYENEKNQPADTIVITARGWGAPPSLGQ